MAFLPYIAGKTLLHRVDPRAKLALLVAILAIPIIFSDVVILFFAVLAAIQLARSARLPFGLLFKILKPLIPLFVLLIVFNGFISGWGTTVLFHMFGFPFYLEGLAFGFAMVLRMLALAIGTSTITMTTSPSDILLGMQAMGLPFTAGFVVSTALRFIPTLLEKSQMIQDAYRSRGLRVGAEERNPFKRVLGIAPTIIPLFLASLELVDKLSLAMQARGFGTKKDVTPVRELAFQRRDRVLLLVTLLLVLTAIGVRAVGIGGTLFGTVPPLT